MVKRLRRPGPNDSPLAGDRSRTSVPLARLFAMAFRTLIDDLHGRLEARGISNVRPAFGFVLLAARDGTVTAKGVAELLGFTKQAGAKVVAAMQAEGYLEQVATSSDARERPLRLSRAGRRVLTVVERIYAELEAEWATELGKAELEAMRCGLTRLLLARHDGELPPIRPTW